MVSKGSKCISQETQSGGGHEAQVRGNRLNEQ